MTERLEPLADHDPGYPRLLDLALARRAALRLLGLGALSALGLELVGCPGGPVTGGGGGGGGGGGQTGIGWVPWRDPNPPPPPGAPPPRQMGPVAVVIGNAPVEVTFQDGRKATLAVALVVDLDDPRAARPGAPEHPTAVRAAAASLPGTVLDDAAGLARLEERVLEELRKASPDLAIEGAQVAPALEDRAPPEPPQQEPARAPSAPSAPMAPPPAAAPPAPAEAPAAAAAPAPDKPRARVWVPCTRPGCTSCGR